MQSFLLVLLGEGFTFPPSPPLSPARDCVAIGWKDREPGADNRASKTLECARLTLWAMILVSGIAIFS
jgi:hypothetical protein